MDDPESFTDLYFFLSIFQVFRNLSKSFISQWAGAVEYTDCTSAEG